MPGNTRDCAYTEPATMKGQYSLLAAPALYRVAGTAPLVAAAIGAAQALTHGLLIKADDANSGKVYVGESATVTADSGLHTSGFPLAAGEELLWYANSPSLVYVVAAVAGQAYVAVGEKAV